MKRLIAAAFAAFVTCAVQAAPQWVPWVDEFDNVPMPTAEQGFAGKVRYGMWDRWTEMDVTTQNRLDCRTNGTFIKQTINPALKADDPVWCEVFKEMTGVPLASAIPSNSQNAKPGAVAPNAAPFYLNIKPNQAKWGFPGHDTVNVAMTDEAPANGDGAFRAVTLFSHFGFDDPLVFPGQPGRSHLHTFMGNTLTNANSNIDTLSRTGNTTVTTGLLNRSAYWMPSMINIETGYPVPTIQSLIYYKANCYEWSKTGNPDQWAACIASVQPLPRGLKMLAGDMMGFMDGHKPMGTFKCITGTAENKAKSAPTIVNCDYDTIMQFGIMFPQCWDGVNLDSVDHRSHMEYASANYRYMKQDAAGKWFYSASAKAGYTANVTACPQTHPVRLVRVSTEFRYEVRTKSDLSKIWRLSSDAMYDSTADGAKGGMTAHADFVDGWVHECDYSPKGCPTDNGKPGFLYKGADTVYYGSHEQVIRQCTAAQKDCHAHLLGEWDYRGDNPYIPRKLPADVVKRYMAVD